MTRAWLAVPLALTLAAGGCSEPPSADNIAIANDTDSDDTIAVAPGDLGHAYAQDPTAANRHFGDHLLSVTGRVDSLSRARHGVRLLLSRPPKKGSVAAIIDTDMGAVLDGERRIMPGDIITVACRSVNASLTPIVLSDCMGTYILDQD